MTDPIPYADELTLHLSQACDAFQKDHPDVTGTALLYAMSQNFVAYAFLLCAFDRERTEHLINDASKSQLDHIDRMTKIASGTPEGEPIDLNAVMGALIRRTGREN